MTIENKYELLTLKEIFDNGNRGFKIPNYQRGYSWESDQRFDMLKDIEYVLKGNYTHYTGTIVASESKYQNGNPKYFEIVDGQQRLTTIIILLSTIRNFAKKKNLDISSFENELQKIFMFSGKESGNTKRKLILSDNQDKIFYEMIKNGFKGSKQVLTKSDQNIINAFNEFEFWLDSNSENLEEIYNVICSRLGFLFYSPKNDNEIGIMFEVINNRGKILSELEKIKNYIIYYSDKNDKLDLKQQVKNSWILILSNLNKCEISSNDQENSFLRNCWLVFKDTNKSKSYNVYENLKKSYCATDESAWCDLLKFVSFIEKSSQIYVDLFKQIDISIIDEKQLLNKLVNQVSIASVLPLLISIYQNNIPDNERIELLDITEKLNFRYYGSGIAGRSDSGQGVLFNLAYQFYNNFNNVDKSGKTINTNWLKSKLINFIYQNANDIEFVKYLTLDKNESGDYYYWKSLKYFLANYEEFLRTKQKESCDIDKLLAERNPKFPNDFFHKEHILATKDYSKISDLEDKDVNKRRLGNFILLKETQNIKVSNDSPEIKVSKYWDDRKNDPNTLMIRELLKDFNDSKKYIDKKWSRKTKNYWYELYQKFFDIREEKLINFALSRWNVKEFKKKIKKLSINSFADKNEIYDIIYDSE